MELINKIVFLGIIFNIICLSGYALLELHVNSSYVGFIALFSVGAIISSLGLLLSNRGK